MQTVFAMFERGRRHRMHKDRNHNLKRQKEATNWQRSEWTSEVLDTILAEKVKRKQINKTGILKKKRKDSKTFQQVRAFGNDVDFSRSILDDTIVQVAIKFNAQADFRTKKIAVSDALQYRTLSRRQNKKP